VYVQNVSLVNVKAMCYVDSLSRHLGRAYQQMCCTVYSVLRVAMVQVNIVKLVALYRN